jgi:hypothetical protein
VSLSTPTPLQASILRLFYRNVEITLITQPDPPTRPTPGQNPGYFDTTQTSSGNAIVITGMRVQYEVKKNLAREPNSATITITNLSRSTRARLERKPVYAIIRAGHDGVLRPLFQGNVMYAKSSLKSPDWETKIQVADGGRAFSYARLSRSYAPPIKIYQVLADAAAAMGTTLPPDLANARALQQALPGGMTAHGPARDVLTKMLAPAGYSFSIQGGNLQILQAGAPNANSAYVIEVDTGMIGSPEASIPHKPGAVSELTVDVLLYPELKPGDVIQVNSKAYSGGFFRINDLQHKGDTHGNDWTTSIKATPLGSPPPPGRGSR